MRRDGRVKTIVLNINSPGGSASGSDNLYSAVTKPSEEKPVVAFIGQLGASGAYLTSCGATKIVATPSALVESIGVISRFPVMKKLLQRLGFKIDVVKSGRFKDMGSFYGDLTDEERQK